MDEYRVFGFLHVSPCRHLLLKPTDKIAIEYDVQTRTSLNVEESVSYYSMITGISQDCLHEARSSHSQLLGTILTKYSSHLGKTSVVF